MYRSSPIACAGCGDAVSPDEADLSEHGLRCWRCSARGDVESLHATLRTRVPGWQRLVARGGLSALCVGSFALVLVAGSAGEGLCAAADAALAGTAVYRLLRRDRRLGGMLAGVQTGLLACAALLGGGPIFVLAAAGGMLGLTVGRRGYPLYPGDAPLLLEANELPLLAEPSTT
ncbi:MAG: hypothetical protein ABI321_21300 [Polyangia bacterium]